MAAGAALSVANLYLLQPLVGTVAREFRATDAAVGQATTWGQIGYAIGLFLIVPLGDMIERRSLTIGSLLASVVALLAMARADSPLVLSVTAFLVGVTTITPQLLVPFAASIALPETRGRAVGTVMSGLLLGILLARTVSGALVAVVGWRGVYVVAAIAMGLLAVSLRFLLPQRKEENPPGSYRELLGSVFRIVREEPVLRRSMLYGACGMAAFSALWSTLTFLLEGPRFRLGPAEAGLFGLAGAAGALAAPLAGRWGDAGRPLVAIRAGLAATLVGWILAGAIGGTIAGLIVAVVVLDFGVQASHVGNQSRFFGLRPEARSRTNTAYMTSYFAGGALGSASALAAWSATGWLGACAVGAIGAGIGLIVSARE